MLFAVEPRKYNPCPSDSNYTSCPVSKECKLTRDSTECLEKIAVRREIDKKVKKIKGAIKRLENDPDFHDIADRFYLNCIIAANKGLDESFTM